MAVFLFWNLNRKLLVGEVSQLCKEHNVDILILAEAVFSEIALQQRLERDTNHKYTVAFNEVSSRLKFFFRYPLKSIAIASNAYSSLSIREIRPPVGHSILIAAVHLASKLHADSAEQAFQARLVVEAIEDTERRFGHRRTLVIGDFNMNPFEAGIVNADAFHGVMSQCIAKKEMRVVKGRERRFFYNPMWGCFGDGSEGPPGTYYYPAAKNKSFFWNMFDQVLLRPSLLPFFSAKNLTVLTNLGDESLLLKSGVINRKFSDHLPIMIKLPIETEDA